MSKLGVLLIGGMRTHQENHARTFSEHPRCRLVAVADESGAPEERHGRNRELAASHGVPYIPDLDDALGRDDAHIVSMCAPIERRAVVAGACARAGKHIYLDKPLCGSVEDADAIVRALQASGVTNQMYSKVHASWVRDAKRTLDSGEIGALRSIHCEELFAKGPAGGAPHALSRREKERHARYTFPDSKREMFDVGVYPLTVIHWLTGRRAESVTALTGNYFFAEHARNDTEDFGAMAITLEGGATASVIAGRYGSMSHPAAGAQRIVLIGDRGTAVFDAFRPRVEVYNNDLNFVEPLRDDLDPMRMWSSTDSRQSMTPKTRWRPLGGGRDVMVDDIAAFVDCVESGERPEITAVEAAESVEILMGAYASAARRSPVRLPLRRSGATGDRP